MAETEGLHQIATASPDGSIFRLARLDGRSMPSVDQISVWHKQAAQIVRAWPGRETLSNREMTLITNHVLLNALDTLGWVQYASAPSGRIELLLDRAVDLIPQIASMIASRT